MIEAKNKTYVASAGADNVIATGKAILHRILIGADVSSSVLEISDSASDGDGNIKIKLTGNTLMTSTGGCIEVGAQFDNGITADIANQTDVTFVWEPIA